MEDFKNLDINKTRNSYQYPAGRITDFSETIRIPIFHPLTHELSHDVRSLESTKSWKKSGSPSEGSEKTVLVSSVANNLERVFLGLAYYRQVFNDSKIEMWGIVYTLYSNIK